jgi:tRNA1(Val) A37 N6-methylase TrmN6
METLEYLENDIKIYQDDNLYKFTSDAILLSKFASVKSGDIIADFCAGSGIVGFNLYSQAPEKIKSVTFFEMQTPLFELCKKSIDYNGLNDRFCAHNIKLQDLGGEFAGKFSLIVCNPPYMPVGRGFYEENDTIAVCRTELTLSLEELCKAIGKALKYGGRTAICHRADRLVEVISQLKKNNIEPKKLQFVCSGEKEPYLLLIEGVKGGKSGIKILKNAKN